MSDPKEIVRSGYDAIAERYEVWAGSFDAPEGRWVESFLARLNDGSNVLDLGCGGGRAAAQAVAARHRYTGVDLSPVQVARARARIPQGEFLVEDAARVEFNAGSFDGVMSLFMMGHVPRAQQGPLLGRMRDWLRPGGWMLATLGTSESDDELEADWLGAPMFFASFDPLTNRGLLRSAGFEIVHEQVIRQDEPGHGPVSFMWVLATRA